MKMVQCLMLFLAVTSASAMCGQAADVGIPPTFDVASIRQHPETADNHAHIYSSAQDGEFRTVNVSVKGLIRMAFALPETRILGGPPWMAAKTFDIQAKSSDLLNDQLRSLPSEQGRMVKQKMVQALLAERFQLKVHEEKRDLPLYALVVGKAGPKLEKSEASGTTVSSGRGRIAVQGSDQTVGLLAEQLANVLGRVVVDETGLQGRYDVKLTWTPDEASGPGTEAVSGPSLFTAIEEQLGLKLEARKGPVGVIVVDQVGEPTAN